MYAHNICILFYTDKTLTNHYGVIDLGYIRILIFFKTHWFQAGQMNYRNINRYNGRELLLVEKYIIMFTNIYFLSGARTLNIRFGEQLLLLATDQSNA